MGGKSFLRENWFEKSDSFSSLLIFTIIKIILSTFFFTVSKFYKNLVKWALPEMECSIAGKRMIMDRKRMAKGCVSLRILKLSHFFVTQENENLMDRVGILFCLATDHKRPNCYLSNELLQVVFHVHRSWHSLYSIHLYLIRFIL